MENEVLNLDDVIETANHFRCIDMIIDHARAALTEKFIKELHLTLKSATSDSRKDWFAVGDYKKLPNEVVFRVKDSGVGIPKEYLSRIFERFFCVDKGRSKKLGGSGLGLSIVKSALKYNNAQIEVKSEVGVGSEFIVHFKI